MNGGKREEKARLWTNSTTNLGALKWTHEVFRDENHVSNYCEPLCPWWDEGGQSSAQCLKMSMSILRIIFFTLSLVHHLIFNLFFFSYPWTLTFLVSFVLCVCGMIPFGDLGCICELKGKKMRCKCSLYLSFLIRFEPLDLWLSISWERRMVKVVFWAPFKAIYLSSGPLTP